jgi:hypothetical protein
MITAIDRAGRARVSLRARILGHGRSMVHSPGQRRGEKVGNLPQMSVMPGHAGRPECPGG